MTDAGLDTNGPLFIEFDKLRSTARDELASSYPMVFWETISASHTIAGRVTCINNTDECINCCTPTADQAGMLCLFKTVCSTAEPSDEAALQSFDRNAMNMGEFRTKLKVACRNIEQHRATSPWVCVPSYVFLLFHDPLATNKQMSSLDYTC